jgi:RNA polymerase sigma factor (sigma-70 family)
VFTRIYTRLDTLRDASALRPWIAQLTRRRCLDVLASKGRELPADEMLTTEETADLAEVEEAFTVRQALGGLSDACQEILDRFFARDQSYKTISAELDIPSGTIASRIARCLGRLRSELEGRNQRESGSRE